MTFGEGDGHHGIGVGGINKRTPLALHGYQPSLLQLTKMKRQRRAGQAEQSANIARRKTLRPIFDERTENIQTGVLREGRKLGDGDVFFHGVD